MGESRESIFFFATTKSLPLATSKAYLQDTPYFIYNWPKWWKICFAGVTVFMCHVFVVVAVGVFFVVRLIYY